MGLLSSHGGKLVIKGTRVPVDLLLGKLAGGATYLLVTRSMLPYVMQPQC